MSSKLFVKDESIQEVLNSESKLKIYLDSNVIIAYLDELHKFNYEAKTLIEPLKQKDCWFFVHYIVAGEFIHAWMILKKSSVNEAIKSLAKFQSSIKHCLIGGRKLNLEIILANYRRYTKHRNFLKAHFNDFIILTEAEKIKNIKIVTCDWDMYKAGELIFKRDIYYLPFKTKKGKSHLGRFISDMEILM